MREPTAGLRAIQSTVYRFGPFTLDLSRGCLLRGSDEIKLRPQSFNVLKYLVERGGRLVGKAELMQAIWPDAAVTDDSLSKCLMDIRKALDDEAQAFVKTVPRRGYLFTGQASEQRPSAALRLEPLEAGAPGIHWWRSRRALAAAAFAALVIGGLAIYFRWAAHEPPPPARLPSIAVLPFQSLDAGESEGFLALGMTDAIITRLMNLRRVVVRPTSSIRKYLDLKADLAGAGRQLGVDMMLEGSVQRSGDRIRVTVQLMGSKDGRPLWAQQFDEQFTDLFALEDRISERVAQTLPLELTADERALLARRHTRSLEAYECYLKGLYFWTRRTDATVPKGVPYLERAVQLDPDYALAYTVLSHCYSYLAYRGLALPEKMRPLAKAAVERAIQVDDSLPEAHRTLAGYRMYHEWDWAGAEHEFRRAIQLNPYDAEAHHFYGNLLAVVGRFDEAIAEKKRALEVDPFSAATYMTLGGVYYYQQQYDQAIACQRKALEIEPNFQMGLENLARAYERTGMLDQAVETYLRAGRLTGASGQELGELERAYETGGFEAYLYRELTGLQTRAKTIYVQPMAFASQYGRLGDRAHALDWLERAADVREPSLVWVKFDPTYKFLRGDARFIALLNRMRFP